MDWGTVAGLGFTLAGTDALRVAADFPLTGTGLNTFGIAMLRYQTVEDGYLYIEAHNDYLHLLAEGGALLVLPALALVVVIVATIRRRFREGADDARAYWLRAGAVTGLLAIAFQSIFDFTLQMPGAAVMAVALAAVAMHRRRTATARPPHAERVSAGPPDA
ncbi:MAG: O-antigen ligase family protein [Vicinamibacteria bacterium]